MVVTTRSRVLDVEDIPLRIREAAPGGREGLEVVPGMALEDMEKALIRRTLEMTKGNREEAAKILKIGERTLYRKLDRYGLK